MNRFKNKYHFNSPRGLINDPNGLVYHKGYYYIFFQWYPYGCEHGLKHWGLIKTKDFINYTSPKIVLTPGDWYDKDGCYSGSGIVKDGVLHLIYTGNVRDEKGNRISYQCLATIDEEDKVVKHGPIIEDLPKGYTSHFRDPMVFISNDKYYMIIGAQNDKLEGKALIYLSSDLKEWEYKGEVKTNLKEFGYMWECPNYFRKNNKDIIIFSPQGLKEEEFNFQNLYQSGYILGDLNIKSLDFSHGEFKELDKGFDFYAPQIMTDPNGRTIMIGWMGMPEEEKFHPTIKDGWVHGLTMPRQLILKRDGLYQQPLEELQELRDEYFQLENLYIDYFSHEKLRKNSYELLLYIERFASEEIEIRLALGEDEFTSFKYNFKTTVATLDRNKMNEGPKGIRKFKMENTDSLKIHIFMDKSALEIYLEDGKEVLTSNIYPKVDSNSIEIISKGGKAKIKNLKYWTLKEVKYND